LRQRVAAVVTEEFCRASESGGVGQSHATLRSCEWEEARCSGEEESEEVGWFGAFQEMEDAVEEGGIVLDRIDGESDVLEQCLLGICFARC
jgi:hypothetical protein